MTKASTRKDARTDAETGVPVPTSGATHVVQFGRGTTEALLIHCSLGHSGGWAGMMEPLAEILRARAVDLPGHGRSADWDGRGDYHDRCTQACLAHMPPSGVLIGHSLGATVALRLALENPGRVRRLVLIEPVFFAAARGSAVHDRYRQGFLRFANAMQSGAYEDAARAFMGIWGAGTPWEQLPQAMREQILQRIPMVLAASPALEDDSHDLLAPGRLEGLEAPVLIMVGEESPEVIRAVAAALAARLSDARIETVAEAGHMMPVTHPEPTASAVSGFLKAVVLATP